MKSKCYCCQLLEIPEIQHSLPNVVYLVKNAAFQGILCNIFGQIDTAVIFSNKAPLIFTRGYTVASTSDGGDLYANAGP